MKGLSLTHDWVKLAVHAASGLTEPAKARLAARFGEAGAPDPRGAGSGASTGTEESVELDAFRGVGEDDHRDLLVEDRLDVTLELLGELLGLLAPLGLVGDGG